MIKTILIAIALLSASAQAEVGKATVFARKVQDGGGKSKCLGRRVLPTDRGIAHRTLPCGTRVRVTNLRTKLSTVAVVIDRGPYGACLDLGWHRGPCSEWAIKRHRSDPGSWRGLADLTPPVAAELNHKSFDAVRIDVLPSPP